jgi:hypothetical protein
VFLIPAGLVAAAAAGTLVLFLIPRAVADSWVGEPGELHYATVVLYAAAAAGILLRGPGRLPRAAGAAGLLLLAAIKLDPGHRLEGVKTQGLAYFTSAENPLLPRILTGAIYLAAAGLLLVTIAAGWRRFRAGLREGRAAPVLVVTAVCMLAASQVADVVQASLTWPKPGWHTHPRIYFGSGVVEAVLEILVPAALLWALAVTGRRSDGDGSASRKAPASQS